MHEAVGAQGLLPGNFGKAGSIRPGSDVARLRSLNSDVVAEDEAKRIVIAAVGGADGFPGLKGGIEGEVIEFRFHAVERNCGDRLRRWWIGRGHPWSEVSLECGEVFGGDFGFGMQLSETRQGHGAELNHIDRFEQRWSLHGGRPRSESGEVQVLAGGENVVRKEPVAGANLIEPGEAAFVGGATVTVVAENLSDLG